MRFVLKLISIKIKIFTYCIIILLLLINSISCGTKNKSARDNKKEQIRTESEIKRNELQQVEGVYQGNFDVSDSRSIATSLHLNMKNSSLPNENGVDTVLYPKIDGQIKLNFNGTEGLNNDEFVAFKIKESEYDIKTNKLNIIAENEKYKEIVLDLKKNDHTLEGTWLVASMSASGNVKFNKLSSSVSMSSPLSENTLRGTFMGNFIWDKYSLSQLSQLTINTKTQFPDSLSMSGNLKIIFGDKDSAEFLVFDYPQVDFNPITGKIIMANDQNEVSFIGEINKGMISGDWYTKNNGKMGTTTLKRALNYPSIDSINKIFPSLKGTYLGKLKNTNAQSGLPPNIMISLVTKLDSTQPEGINISGNLRFYYGDFNSLEYEEIPFDKIKFNFFTRDLVLSTSGQYSFTIKAISNPDFILGKISNNTFGELADIELKKQ